MRINNRISTQELQQLVLQLQKNVPQQYLQNIYHYHDKWLLKWSGGIHLVYDKNCLWNGSFSERETEIHSVCIKLRKELHNAKCLAVFMPPEDRTLLFEFHNYFLIMEFFAKGNILLVEKESLKIVVLTRIYANIRHHYQMDMAIFNSKKEQKGNETHNNTLSCSIRGDEIFFVENGEYENFFEALGKLWEIKNQKEKKPPKIQKSKKDQLEKQKDKIEEKLLSLDCQIEEHTELCTNFEKLGQLCQERKKHRQKLEKVNKHILEKNATVEKQEQKSNQNTILNFGKWYHEYYWWYTKNGFLVVGGKNATQNEKLVKTYLKEDDLYFHIQDNIGSGSFIMFHDKQKKPNDIDCDETAEGVLALSNYWNHSKTGNVYYVKGHQVSKTPESGEYVTKGSFIVRGSRNMIRVQNTTLGYCVVGDFELMLAPYRIIYRVAPHCHIKISTGQKKWKLKDFTKTVHDIFGIVWNDQEWTRFQKPCLIQTVCRESEKIEKKYKAL